MFKLGMIPSPPDKRDYPLSKVISYRANPILNRVVWMPEPVNQGQTSCCVAVTIAGILECIEKQQRGVPVQTSIKFIYGNRKETDYQGEGMMPREALHMVSRFGSPRRELLPGLSDYPTAKESITPTLDGEGLPNRIKGYVRLRTLQDISDYMTLFNLPVVFGMTITDTFYNVAADGKIPPPGGVILGGHCMRGIGITNQQLVCQNSWGDWGASGLCFFDFGQNHDWEAWGVIPESSDTVINRPQEIFLTVGSTTMLVDGQPITLDSPPVVINQRTMVPLRAISEALKGKVEYYGQANGKHMIILRWGGEQETL